MKSLFTRLFSFPVEKKTVDVACIWEVRWISRSSRWPDSPHLVTCRPELEAFYSEEDAVAFKEYLDEAFHKLKYSGGGLEVTVTKARV